MKLLLSITIALLSTVPQLAFCEASRVETVRAFLSSPPPVNVLEFKRRDLYQPDCANCPKVNTNHYRCFFARYQSGDFVVREVSSFEEIADPQTLTNTLIKIYGKNGSTFWKILGDNCYFWEDKEAAFSSDYSVADVSPTETILFESSIMRAILLQLLHMGISDLKSYSVKWTGDAFTAVDSRGLLLKGTLTAVGDTPKELTIHYPNDPGNYVVEYTYTETSRLPQQLKYAYVDKTGLKRYLTEFVILSFRIAETKMSQDDFAAESFKVAGFTQTIKQDGKTLSWQNPKGGTVVIANTTFTHNIPKLFVFVIVVISVAVAVFGFMRFQTTTKKE